MKAYIKTFEEGTGYKAEVVTEDDYHNRGPFAHSYRTPWYLSEEDAKNDAMGYCLQNNLTLVPARSI